LLLSIYISNLKYRNFIHPLDRIGSKILPKWELGVVIRDTECHWQRHRSLSRATSLSY